MWEGKKRISFRISSVLSRWSRTFTPAPAPTKMSPLRPRNTSRNMVKKNVVKRKFLSWNKTPMCVALTQKGVNFGSRFNIGSSRRRNFCQGLFINSEEAWHSFQVTKLKTDIPICGSTSAFNPKRTAHPCCWSELRYNKSDLGAG